MNRIEEVKKILDRPIAWIHGMKCASEGMEYYITEPQQDELARQIDEYYSQLFPQPLMDGDVEKELAELAELIYNFKPTIGSIKENIRSFLLANHLKPRPQPLDGKELREWGAKWLATVIESGEPEEGFANMEWAEFSCGLNGEKATQEYREAMLELFDQVCAKFQPKIEEAFAKGITQYREEICPMRVEEARKELLKYIEENIFNLCEVCCCKVSKGWQALKGENK